MSGDQSKIYADPTTCRVGTLEDIVGPELSRKVWITAYLGALGSGSAQDAAAMAETALRLYADRWCNIIEVPPGKDPIAYLQFYNHPDTMAGGGVACG